MSAEQGDVMGKSPFPQPPLESEEKGLGRDHEIPSKPADVVAEVLVLRALLTKP